MALAEFAFYCVRNAGANNWYLDEVTLCVLDALADSLGDFNRLTGAYANVTIAVAYNYQGCKAHVASALNGLCYAVDGYKPILQFHCGCIYTFLHIVPP